MEAYIAAFGTKEVSFRFRGRDYAFALSQGLFSSAGIDAGTALLLRFFSRMIDDDTQTDRPPPKMILDAGCGIGVIGICAAASFPGPGGAVRAQDRDELARVFTEYNARQNGIPADLFEAHTEPLLAGPPESRWDLILSNVPAKAGKPVLEDFVFRSAGLLNDGGRCLIVVVNPLEEFFRGAIAAANAPLLGETEGPGHHVFLYGPSASSADTGCAKPTAIGKSFFQDHSFYRRANAVYTMEDTSYQLETIHGAADFDSPGGEIQAAAKLFSRLMEAPSHLPGTILNSVLIHEGGQGHFSAWLAARFSMKDTAFVLSGRNILALEAALHNAKDPGRNHFPPRQVQIISAVDPFLDGEKLRAAAVNGYSLIAAFPEIIPQTSYHEALWESFDQLLAKDGIALVGLSSTEAERFDRKKPKGYTRLGDLKRKGFRALAYSC
ncbi:hypothetical protein AGMMS49928_27170 [Spirochaetia bacterium]|nr:hypothetical protein AGMMS49928_27170 [Spirochaetia bacterium]